MAHNRNEFMSKLTEAFSYSESKTDKDDLLLQAILRLLDYIIKSKSDGDDKLFKRMDILENNIKPRLFAMQS